jgi:outer membrane lipoprotein-sorting protein
MRKPFPRSVILACASLIAFAAVGAAAQPDEILKQTLAKYAALHSYADTGVTTTEYRSPGAPATVERHTFTTLYKTPRQYLFDFQRDPKAGVERFVIWGDGEDFHTWWSATKVHDTYPRGRGATAFAIGSTPTKGTALLLAPLLFAQAGLHGSIADFAATGSVEIEEVGGRRCHKIAGEVRSTYGTGAVVGTRQATLWIDAETLLVRKIFEDTPTGTGGGVTTTITTTLEPQANPELPDARFRFAPPAGKE